jgi:hypothetical protein
MSSRLDKKPQIWKLAVDLGLPATEAPTRAILRWVTERIRGIAKKYRCSTLNELLVATAGEVGTSFEEVHSDEDLQRIKRKYVAKGEKAFANLENELRTDDYAITVRRLRPEKWDPPFISVIDCRDSKLFGAYFSKWHELAHLLTLTPQMRLVFRRTHAEPHTEKDPEESLMDVIAGELGFFVDFLPSGQRTDGDVSFEKIQRIREECCPEASWQAAVIGIVKALPQPCILIQAEMALRRREAAQARQMSFGIVPDAVPALRAVHATINNAARDLDILFHQNWRVPKESVICHVYEKGGYAESIEDLAWWATSDGCRLGARRVAVKAKKVRDAVFALLVPQD